MKIQTVILAAGKSTRMGGTSPKVLLPFRGKPLVRYVVDSVTGLQDMPKPVVVVGFGGEQIKEALGDNCDYALQSEQIGTANAVNAARSKITADNLLVLYGDSPCIKSSSLEKIIDLHYESFSPLTMFTATVPNFSEDNQQFFQFGRIIRDKDGQLEKIVEYKDATENERKVTEINAGIYLFKTKWLWGHLPLIKSHNQQGEYYLTDIVGIALTEGISIQTASIDSEEVRAVNTPEDLAYLESNFN